MSDAAAPKSRMQKMLDTVERVGNQVPHPVMIFVYLIGGIIVLSTLLSIIGAEVNYQAYNPATGEIEPASTAARSVSSAIAGVATGSRGEEGSASSSRSSSGRRTRWLLRADPD